MPIVKQAQAKVKSRRELFDDMMLRIKQKRLQCSTLNANKQNKRKRKDLNHDDFIKKAPKVTMQDYMSTSFY